jgi:hypothetical protein
VIVAAEIDVQPLPHQFSTGEQCIAGRRSSAKFGDATVNPLELGAATLIKTACPTNEVKAPLANF